MRRVSVVVARPRAFSQQAARRREDAAAGRRAFTSPLELDGRSYLLPTLRVARRREDSPAAGDGAPRFQPANAPRKRTPVVLDLQLVSSDGSPHSQAIRKHELRAEVERLQSVGYVPVGVTNASDDVKEVAAKLQLPYLISTRLSVSQQQPQPREQPAAVATGEDAPAASREQQPLPQRQHAQRGGEGEQEGRAGVAAALAQEAQPPLVIARSVRSGQQVYARARSLVVLGGVSSGAEVLADDSIFVLGALKGRALAGIGGNARARIFCHSFDAELVSIAHHFTTCDDLAREDSGALRPQSPTGVSLRDDQLHFESTDM